MGLLHYFFLEKVQPKVCKRKIVFCDCLSIVDILRKSFLIIHSELYAIYKQVETADYILPTLFDKSWHFEPCRGKWGINAVWLRTKYYWGHSIFWTEVVLNVTHISPTQYWITSCVQCPHQHGGSKSLQDTNGHIYSAFSWNYACCWYVGFSSRFKWLQFVLNPNSRHFYCPLSCLSDYMNTLLRHTHYAMVLPVAKEHHQMFLTNIEAP